MTKEEKVTVKDSKAEEVLGKEKAENSIPLESGDWVNSLKSGDLVYSAGYERDDEGNGKVMILTLKFIEYDSKSVVDEKTRIATLIPIVDGKEAESVKVPNQNLRVGYFPSKLEAVKAFEDVIASMLSVIKETREQFENESKETK